MREGRDRGRKEGAGGSTCDVGSVYSTNERIRGEGSPSRFHEVEGFAC